MLRAARLCVLTLATCALGALSGCATASAGPVLGHPWFEDHELGLERERLLLHVQDSSVAVEARFEFRHRTVPTDRLMAFVIPPPCSDAQGFSAALEGPGRQRTVLPTRHGDPPALPMGEIAETYDVLVRGADLARHDALVVRYRQKCKASFRYTLVTGAYWHGPIEELKVVVTDPDRQLVAAWVEDEPPHIATATSYGWTFRSIEPRSGVLLELKKVPSRRCQVFRVYTSAADLISSG